MQRDITRQLDHAVAEVFAVMLHLACTPEPLLAHSEVTGFAASVLFSGSFEGVCTLTFNPVAAAEITANLTGIPAAEISPDLCADTTSELCNMIAGSWKSTQSKLHDLCHISCPTVVYDQAAAPSSGGQTIARVYRYAGGHFSLRLSLG